MTKRKHLLEKTLYQLIVARLEGARIWEEPYQKRIFRLIRKGVGGFILFGGKRDKVKDFIRKMQAEAEMSLFIASDTERGVGQQIQGFTNSPCQMAVSAAIDKNSREDISILYNAIKSIADEAVETGINMPLIPVLDVNRDPDNPIICTRAFSDNTEIVSWFGLEYIRILEESGLLSCAKHFPGHGDTSIDSHIRLPVIRKSYKDLMKTDLAPFKKAIKAGVGSIMIGHLVIPSIDDKPASLSEKVINGLLREELGFAGLVLTDALNMHALKGITNVSAQCLNAGADVLLHPADADATVRELLTALESKEISEDLIDIAAGRISHAKGKMQKRETDIIDYKKHEMLSSRITGKSITLVKDTKGILPLTDADKVSIILAGDEEYFKSFPFSSTLKKWGEGGFSDNISVFAIFASVSAWKGSSGIAESEKNKIKKLIRQARHSIVISFGSPYILRHFNDADILIAAYEATEQTQRAVMERLEGKAEFEGTLPVKLDV
jgi:beta-N-acetylhexosaminidase